MKSGRWRSQSPLKTKKKKNQLVSQTIANTTNVIITLQCPWVSAANASFVAGVVSVVLACHCRTVRVQYCWLADELAECWSISLAAALRP